MATLPEIPEHIPQVSMQDNSIPSKPTFRQDRRYEKEGKRWIRRRDNSRFAGNGHIVKPSTKDFSLSYSYPRTTFPKPLPSFLPRHPPAPSASAPLRDPASANAGRYSLSLKGVRKELRRSGPGAERIVLDIERELTDWLQSGGILLSPDAPRPISLLGGTPLGSSSSIVEITRSPTELIWRIDADFVRFLLHCVARFHGIVSFSKTMLGTERDIRLTHLLRPNVTRPDFMAPGALDTPPTSDIDAFSVILDTEDSDAASEFTFGSTAGDLPASSPRMISTLISEEMDDRPTRSLNREYSETGSFVGEREDDALSHSVASITLEDQSQDWEQTPRRRGVRAVPLPSRSPSRPVRRNPRRPRAHLVANNQLGFWNYVFA
ncbi:hypothetical protein K439DRAFT_1632235 [Ramaria rubella]|nr:hypothetical protein K439DRAFT_1632235 [Ramaria rubella]